jgi:membrane-associated phospholipid phosphatase
MCTRIICHSRNNNEAAPEYSFIASSDTVAHRRDPRPGSAATFKRSVSLKQLVPNILEDQKSMWSFPSRFAKGKDLIPTAAFAVIGTALVVGADAPAARYFRNTPAFDGYNRALPSAATSAAILAAPIALYGAGLIRKDSKMTTTALLAGEAAADAEILTEVFKPAVSRWRPSSLPPDGNFADTFAEGGNRFSSAHNSFPSGHAITAFAVATVVSRRYGRQRRWVPLLAYAGAAAIGFSRLTLSAHYTSDVFVGAALGYSISRFAVLGN